MSWVHNLEKIYNKTNNPSLHICFYAWLQLWSATMSIDEKHCPTCQRRLQAVAFSGQKVEYLISATEDNKTVIMKFCNATCLLRYDTIMVYLANGEGKYTDNIYKNGE